MASDGGVVVGDGCDDGRTTSGSLVVEAYIGIPGVVVSSSPEGVPPSIVEVHNGLLSAKNFKQSFFSGPSTISSMHSLAFSNSL